jgi:S1-C subfamily serine protease
MPSFPPSPPPPHERPTRLRDVVVAVLWSFFGVRRNKGMQRDVTTLRPHHVILVGIALAAVLVIGLILLVRLIVSSAHAQVQPLPPPPTAPTQPAPSRPAPTPGAPAPAPGSPLPEPGSPLPVPGTSPSMPALPLPGVSPTVPALPLPGTSQGPSLPLPGVSQPAPAPEPQPPAAPAVAPAPPAPLSYTAEAVYADARPRLLQIRTLVQSAGGQATLGSGFLVTASGLALTNYHVVSQYALDPGTYRLEYVAADGTRGDLKLHAIDVANDLAVVQLDRRGLPFFRFDAKAVSGALPKGERLFAMGNPLDLGFTIVEGTYNGLVDKSYNDRVHFSGALNPGMSGGPAVTAAGEVAGVNVAKQVGGDLVSFLVPARHAAALLERAEASGPMTAKEARSEIGRQLTAWQATLYEALAARGFRPVRQGPYVAPESAATWFSCWSRTNAADTPRPRAVAEQTSCSTQASLFVAGDLDTGEVDLAHAYLRSVDLNAFQFAAFASELYRSDRLGSGRRRRLTPAQCQEDFVAAGDAAAHPLLRVVWCARAYRDFAGLYDVAVTAVTQDRNREALVSRLYMRGASWDNARSLAARFLGSIGFAS